MRRRSRPAVAELSISAPARLPAAVAWDELSEDERTALKRLNRGSRAELTPELCARLITLGLAVPRHGGVGISRAGRELVINVLLEAAQRHADPS